MTEEICVPLRRPSAGRLLPSKELRGGGGRWGEPPLTGRGWTRSDKDELNIYPNGEGGERLTGIVM
ncbi:hypothetical protein EYF80_065924 [Liparis tanakae]|uniref:Uncharacterized protein n=1 Tax=Liparis tanakae TaxID=230148 RepID=A0A4Z2E5M2_9TELE|nr:hypothetical protein EYF80_065924 [Liparis tanakae]